MSWIRVNDVFDELCEENKRLLNELKFITKLNEKYRKYFIDFNNNCKCFANNQNKRIFNEEIDTKFHQNEDYIQTNEEIITESVPTLTTRSDELIDSEEVVESNCKQNNSCFVSKGIKIKSKTNKSLKLKSNLRSNAKQSEKPTKDYFCPQIDCNLKLKTSRELKTHYLEKHSIDGQFVCHFIGCGKGFEYMYKLCRHSKTHLSNNKMDSNEDIPQRSCHFCPKSDCLLRFETNIELQTHYLSNHSIDGKIVCDFNGCEKEFRNASSLGVHINSHISVTPKGERSYTPKGGVFKCDFLNCDYTARRFRNFESHMNGHKGLTPYACDYGLCGKAFKSSHLLKLHIKVNHLNNNRFKCDYKGCSTTCATKHSYNTHKLIHSTDRLFRCTHLNCKFRTKQLTELQVHRKTHSNDRQFKCTVEGCDKAFTDKRGLHSHLTITHSAERNYRCDIDDCGKAFKTNKDLRVHRTTHSLPSIPCHWPGCEYLAGTTQALRSHYITHSSDSNYRCDWPECTKTFKFPNYLKEHMRIHTNDKKFVCHWPGCHYRCSDSSNIYKHFRVHKKNFN